MISSACATDVLIIGGGPAGLATALALRQKEIRCMVVDALIPPIEKSCGEGLMPQTLASLKSLGIALDSEDGYPLQGIRFICGNHKADTYFKEGKGMGVRRLRLHSQMYYRAQDAGAQFALGSHAKFIDEGKALVDGHEVRFGWLVGADGTASSVRRWAGLGCARHFSQRFGFRRHYQISPWSDSVEVYWGKTGELYVTPISSDQICVVFMTRAKLIGQNDFLSEFPEVAAKLRRAAMSTPQRAGASVTQRLKNVASSRVALVGDASGSVDAITGEGLALALCQAIALASSIEEGCLKTYERVHRKIGKTPYAMTRLLLCLDSWPVLQGPVIRGLSLDERLFAEMMSVHLGSESMGKFALRRGPALGFGLVAALTQIEWPWVGSRT